MLAFATPSLGWGTLEYNSDVEVPTAGSALRALFDLGTKSLPIRPLASRLDAPKPG